MYPLACTSIMEVALGEDPASSPESSYVAISLKDGEVLIAEAGQERGTADGGGATARQCHLCPVAVGQLVCGRQGGVSDLRDPHVLEHLQEGKEGRTYKL